jgi:dTDP-4-amino-4,6-dideoxygalactose transaminase
LPRLDVINQQRRDHARQLLAGVADLTSLTTPGIGNGIGYNRIMENTKQPIYLRLPILTNTPAQADTIFALLKAAGIGVGRMYGRTLTEFFPHLAGPSLAGSERVARTLLTLPTNHHLSAEEIARIPELVRKALTSV